MPIQIQYRFSLYLIFAQHTHCQAATTLCSSDRDTSRTECYLSTLAGIQARGWPALTAGCVLDVPSDTREPVVLASAP
jgi:hypothetical protein